MELDQLINDGEKIKFTDIPVIIEKLLSRHKRIEFPSLEAIEIIEEWVKAEEKTMKYQM